MRCPFCGFQDTQVKDSRAAEDNMSIRRRRLCSACGSRFTTFERAQLSEIVVVKNSGDRVLFERDKLAKSIFTALRKRPMDTEQVERVISGIVRKIEVSGNTEITTKEIGALTLESLRNLDPVAYIRFASVYQDFSTLEDFRHIMTTFEGMDDEGGEGSSD